MNSVNKIIVNQDGIIDAFFKIGYTNNPEWIYVITDNDEKLLAGIKTNGEIEWTIGIPTPIKNYIEEHIKTNSLEITEDVSIGGNIIEYVDNPNWLQITTDKDGRILEGIKSDGSKYIYNFHIETIDELQESIDNMEIEIENLETKFSYQYPPMHLFPVTDLPCCNFQFDDAVGENDYILAQLFQEYGLTCGFAFPTTSMSRKDEYLKLQQKGFTILNHSIDGNPFGDKLITITNVNIQNGSGTISGTVDYGGITLTYPDMLYGTLYNSTTGDATIEFNGITRQGSNYVFSVFNVVNSPSVGGTFKYRQREELSRKIFAVSKYDLEKQGFIINGWVSPSSTMNSVYQPALKSFHTYGFTSYAPASATENGRNHDRCDLHRFSIEGGNTLQNIYDFIDLSIQNDQLITFIGHAYNIGQGWTLEKLRSIIEYCIDKRDKGLLWLGNPDDCIRNFFKL